MTATDVRYLSEVERRRAWAAARVRRTSTRLAFRRIGRSMGGVGMAFQGLAASACGAGRVFAEAVAAAEVARMWQMPVTALDQLPLPRYSVPMLTDTEMTTDSVFAGIANGTALPVRLAPEVAHIEDADAWNCNCRECFDIRAEASDFDGASGIDEVTGARYSVGWTGVQIAP